MDIDWLCSSLGRGVRAALGETRVLLKSWVTQIFPDHEKTLWVSPILIVSIVSVIIGATCVLEEWG